jgi:cardiolipin synthase
MEILLPIVYLLILVTTMIRILLDTHSTPKTLAYLLLVLVLPLVGVIIYFAFGINYRHRRYNRKAVAIQLDLDKDYKRGVLDETTSLLEKEKDSLKQYANLAEFQNHLMGEILSQNVFKLLVNGEEKFPEVLKTLEKARNFIHMEYYDWENDVRGNQIKDILLKKVTEGVEARVLYDDYASRSIRRNIVKELREGGVEIHPKIRVKITHFANRINHRDHRKVIIVDGRIGFVGGINISDRYDNSIDTGLYWRDTHVKFIGPLAHSMQRHFIVSWNASQPKKLEFSKELFPEVEIPREAGIYGLGQIMAGGPIYPMSNIMLTYFRIFTLAGKKLYITNPYFIPSDSILDALKQAAVSGVDVRLMLPEKSDSAIVGAASKFFFSELLQAGVRIFLYKKGFVHAKTVVADTFLSVVGTANMDIRSFDLNFEIMSVIYGEEFGRQLENVFLEDLKLCDEVKREDWEQKGFIRSLTYAVARLISSFL